MEAWALNQVWLSLCSVPHRRNGDLYRNTRHPLISALLARPPKDIEISTELVFYPLDSAPDFVALSYVWGDSHDTYRIRCQGQQLFVTRNLRDTLWRIKESIPHNPEECYVKGIDADTMYLWVDAVCINQVDVAEKTRQSD